MASRCEIRLAAASEEQAQQAAHQAIEEVRRIEARFSRYRADSVVSRINAAAGGEPIEVDDETAALIDFGATLWQESAGRFDLSSGVLRRAWDFKTARVPTAQELDALIPLVGWDKVHWRRPSIRLARGMEIDFGGIGKEYAADRAAHCLGAAGITSALVNLGGDVRAVGLTPEQTPWRIGIQQPRATNAEAVIGCVDLMPSAAVATSGDYERYFECDGRRYCHILDPRSGWPAHFWQSVSVSAPACIAAGACSTVAMLMPVSDALAFLKQQGVGFLAVDASGQLHSHQNV